MIAQPNNSIVSEVLVLTPDTLFHIAVAMELKETYKTNDITITSS